MDQKVQSINIKELILWTENPRDPIDENATDQDIVDKAMADKLLKWNLVKLAKSMGSYYDFSELPTVVYQNKCPVVYDGNRRVILGKIKHGLVDIPDTFQDIIPYFPEELPCNVCSKEIALENIYRKHSGTGSWRPLERDIFLHKLMRKEKSTFFILDECTGIITENPHLNKVFVKKEIFKDEHLKAMGFSIQNGKLKSRHANAEALSILQDISDKIKSEAITTRKERGKVIEVLEPFNQEIIQINKTKKLRPFIPPKSEKIAEDAAHNKRKARRTRPKKGEMFGGSLYLSPGEVSNLYRDIVDLYGFYTTNKDRLSHSFPSLLRMSLRLLCEAAAKDKDLKLDKYINGHFAEAKKKLSQDTRTTLANQNVTEASIVQLLHTGAHNYQASSNIEQTLAISIIVGAIISISHGQG